MTLGPVWHPDLVLLDITMPVMNGLEALREILKVDPNARVVMVTALSAQKVVMEALMSGAADFIVKPTDPQKLAEVIEALVA